MTWSALIPGLREIRGPLVAGYFWMLAIWLTLGDQLPGRDTDEVFERLWELGDVLGPVGLAAAASLVAYLIGSLTQAVIASVVARIRRRGLRWLGQQYGLPEDQDVEQNPWIPVDTLLNTETHNVKQYIEIPFADVAVAESLKRLENAELSEARFRLYGAVRHALHASNGDGQYRFLAWRNQLPIIGVPRADRDLADLVIPQFSPFDDLWKNRSLLETRLREVVPSTATKIERLDSEASFREAVSVPMAVAIAVLAIQASLFWLALLALPVALLRQALSLRSVAANELADALRARSGTPELEGITPVFMQYREQAEQLTKALTGANWENPTYVDELVEAGIRKRSP